MNIVRDDRINKILADPVAKKQLEELYNKYRQQGNRNPVTAIIQGEELTLQSFWSK